MPGVRSPFLLRRMTAARLLLASLTVTVLVTSALLTALASFDAQVLPAAAHRQLAASPQTSVLVSGPVDGQIAAADAPTVSAALKAAFGPVPYQLDRALWSNPLGLAAVPGSRVIRLVEAAAAAQLPANTTLVSGHWPGAPAAGQPIPVTVPAAAASQLHLKVGAVLAVRDRDTHAPARLKVAGVYQLRDPAARYWDLDIVGTSGVATQPGFVTYGPLVVSPAVFAGQALAVGQASWLALPEPAGIQTGDMAGLAARLTHTVSYLQGLQRLGGLQVTTGLPKVLTGLNRNLAVARSLLVISALQLLLLAAAALMLAGRLLTAFRADETALLSSRGAARWQLVRITLPETVALAAAAAAVGALAGGRLADLLARTGPLASAGFVPAGFPATAWLALAVIVVMTVTITLWPVLRPVTPGAARVRKGRQVAVAGIARSGADVGLIVLALLAVRELRAYSAVAHLSAGGLGVDPVLVLAPALALVAVSLVLLRLLPLVARGLERLIARSRHLGGALASWEISRRAVTQSGPVLLAVLAVATGTLALAQYQSWSQSARDQAAYTAGADVRVDTAGAIPLDRAGSAGHAPGVSAVMPVSRVTATSGATVLALDASKAPATVLLRPDLSSLPAAALWRTITPASAAPGLLLPGHPARAEITARVRSPRGAAPLGRLSATVIVQDATGAIYTVPAGSLPADGHEHALTVSLSPTHQAAYPLRLVNLTLTYALPAFPVSPQAKFVAERRSATLDISGIAVSASATGPFGAPFAAGGALANWQPAVTSAVLEGLGFGSSVIGDRLPSLTSGVGVVAGARQVSFLPGNVPNLHRLVAAMGPRTNTGDLGTLILAPPGSDSVVAGIATAGFLAASHAHLGSVVPVPLPGLTVRVKIVATVASFPTATTGLVVDQRSIEDVLASRGAAALPVTQLWLATAGDRVPPGLAATLPAGSTLTSRARLQADLLHNALSVAPLLEGLAIAAAAALLAAVGFCAGVIASVRARRAQSALLAALGHSRSAQARGLCLEELMLTGPAALAGLAIGLLLAHLLIPAMTLTTAAGAPVPAVLVRAPLGWAVLLTLAVIAVPVVVASFVVARRPDPAAELRAAEA